MTIFPEDAHIAISGLIGVGKTTLCDDLAKELGFKAYHEQVENNPYLELFYKDQKAFAFPLQIHLLKERVKQQQQLFFNEEGVGTVQDRSIFEDMIFATMLKNEGKMTELDYNTYVELFKLISANMPHPTLIVHLVAKPETCLGRIQQRNRGMEKEITLDYLQKLDQAYTEFLKSLSRKIPVIRVGWEQYKSTKDLALAIQSTWDSMHLIQHIA